MASIVLSQGEMLFELVRYFVRFGPDENLGFKLRLVDGLFFSVLHFVLGKGVDCRVFLKEVELRTAKQSCVYKFSLFQQLYWD